MQKCNNFAGEKKGSVEDLCKICPKAKFCPIKISNELEKLKGSKK